METITVRRKDNGKLKIMNPANFDPAKHERLDAGPESVTVDEKPKRGRKAKG
jgi:hypothetical protein